MTYCIGLKLEDGLVLLSDTRTNAGVDNIARFQKMYIWEDEGKRAVIILSAGNLSITQGIITRLNKSIELAKEDPEHENILNCESMFRVTQIVGDAMREMQDRHRRSLEEQGADSDVSLIVAGQRKGGSHRLFLVYSAGNFIEATEDTPFFQLGEHKYGKPILDRVITPETSIPTALKAALVSMDSTLRSNLSVGMPLDLAIIKRDTYSVSERRRINHDDSDFLHISTRWAETLIHGFESLPEVLTADDSGSVGE